MGEVSKIAWTDATFNPWWGCTKVSPGCDNCYAERDANRYGSKVWGLHVPRRYFGDKHWQDPIRWNKKAKAAGKRMKVFCASMADILDNEVPQEVRERLWELIVECDWLDWQLLTKRIGNARAMLPHQWYGIGELPQHVWFGISVVNQAEADRDIPKLQELTGLLWLSVEPQLGPIDLAYAAFNGCDSLQSLPGISWVVVGGESGSKARPFELDWARSIIAQCKTAGIACFVKQLGDNPTEGILKTGANNEWDNLPVVRKFHARAGADPDEWPELLRVREFPK